MATVIFNHQQNPVPQILRELNIGDFILFKTKSDLDTWQWGVITRVPGCTAKHVWRNACVSFSINPHTNSNFVHQEDLGFIEKVIPGEQAYLQIGQK